MEQKVRLLPAEYKLNLAKEIKSKKYLKVRTCCWNTLPATYGSFATLLSDFKQ